MNVRALALPALSILVLTPSAWGAPLKGMPVAKAGTSPALLSPTPSNQGPGLAIAPSPDGNRMQARATHALHVKGVLIASEAVSGNVHQLTGMGIGTHLGRFTYAATIIVDDTTGAGDGSVVWTAANGGMVHTTMHGELVGLDYPMATIEEVQAVTGGTGRFENATGTICVSRTLNLDTGETSGTFTGTIKLAH